MKKYLVDVYVPSVSKHYDVLLPAEKKIGEATMLLVEIVESLSNKSYKGSQGSMLLRADNGVPLDKGATVFESKIRNATRLILI
ncbi:MAG: EsaB/YukD family protein [Defluviitaleaceae bacterium]|nr:EsaB/YukD family protein [Defluviitaleaceae bacterium]